MKSPLWRMTRLAFACVHITRCRRLVVCLCYNLYSGRVNMAITEHARTRAFTLTAAAAAATAIERVLCTVCREIYPIKCRARFLHKRAARAREFAPLEVVFRVEFNRANHNFGHPCARAKAINSAAVYKRLPGRLFRDFLS